MIYEELLHDFVDGSLDYQGEATLFSELHVNEGLRGELKILMMMQKAIPHDVRAYSPATESQEKIFRRLGFSTGMEVVAEPRFADRASYLSRYLQGIIGGIVGAMLMAAIFLLADRFNAVRPEPVASRTSAARTIADARTSDAKTNRAVTQTGQGFAPGTPNAPAHAGVNANDGGDAGMAAAAILPPTHRPHRSALGDGSTSLAHGGVARAIDPEQGGGARRSLDATRDATTVDARAALSPTALRRSSTSAGTDIDAHLSRADGNVPMAPSSLDGVEIADVLPVTIELRAMTSRNFRTPPGSLGDASASLLKDRAITVAYALNSSQSIALDVGQEEYYQRYQEVLPNGGDIVLHEQNPTLLWGGASFRQMLPSVTNLHPYAQLTLGAARIGPMGRLLLGTSYEITPELELFAGGELSAIAYRFNGNWNTSQKYGVTYGAALRF